jgi:hypothetical protein
LCLCLMIFCRWLCLLLLRLLEVYYLLYLTCG